MNAETESSQDIANAVELGPDEGRRRLIDWAFRYFEGTEPDPGILCADFDFGELAAAAAESAERAAAPEMSRDRTIP